MLVSSMRQGDLVVVRRGCGDEGKIGIIFGCFAMGFEFNFYDVLFTDRTVNRINGEWLEVISGI